MLSIVQQALGLRARRPGQATLIGWTTPPPRPGNRAETPAKLPGNSPKFPLAGPSGPPADPVDPEARPADAADSLLIEWSSRMDESWAEVPAGPWVSRVAGDLQPYASDEAVRLAKALVLTGASLRDLTLWVPPAATVEALAARRGDDEEPGVYVGRLTFPEWVRDQARRYRALNTEAGDLVADAIDDLATEIDILKARTPDEVHDRRDAYIGLRA